jgi:membrane protein implicated in regulation of membrane protease activity
LGAAPGLVWASGIVFAAAFVVLIPLAVWIYTVVFAFSSLWFTHFSLAALQQLRQEQQAQQRHSGHLKPSRSEYEDATVIRLIHDHESTHHE